MPAATIVVPAHISDRELEQLTRVADQTGRRVIIDYPEQQPEDPPELYPGQNEAMRAVAAGAWDEA